MVQPNISVYELINSLEAGNWVEVALIRGGYTFRARVQKTAVVKWLRGHVYDIFTLEIDDETVRVLRRHTVGRTLRVERRGGKLWIGSCQVTMQPCEEMEFAEEEV